MNRLKLLIVSSIVVLLPGCALWDAYNMAGYDSYEYSLINRVRTLAEANIEECKDSRVSKENFETIHYVALEFKNFTQHIPNNDDTHKLANNVLELAKQGRKMYAENPNVSEAFCKLKLQQIGRTTEMAQKVIGKKPR